MQSSISIPVVKDSGPSMSSMSIKILRSTFTDRQDVDHGGCDTCHYCQVSVCVCILLHGDCFLVVCTVCFYLPQNYRMSPEQITEYFLSILSYVSKVCN